MFRSQSLILLFFVSFLFSACGNSAAHRAAEKIQEARRLYSQGDTSLALQLLDSIPVFYREEIAAKAEAQKFQQQIVSAIIFRRQNTLDSVNRKVDLLKKDFHQEKTVYDRYTQYVYKRQDPTKRWNKSYLQVHLNEQGDLYLSSNYFGEKWLYHTAVRVYDGKLQAKTDKVPLKDVLNHHSDFMNTKWEKVTYRNGKDNGVIAFIAQHADSPLKAVFLGQRYYYILLEEYDKKAFREAWELSALLKQQKQLKNSIQKLQASLR